MSENENGENQAAVEEEREFDSGYLRAVVRLAELRMTEQSALQNGYERKAVLLITFCVVLVGYLLTGEWTGWAGAVKFAAMAYLMISVDSSIRIFEFAESGVQGIHPRTIGDISVFGGKTDALLAHAGKEYAERIDRNDKTLNMHVNRLKFAKRYFYAGLASAAVIALWEKSPPALLFLWEKVHAIIITLPPHLRFLLFL